MQAALGDLQPPVLVRAGNSVDEAVLLGDAARPPALQFEPERLRLARAGERRAPALLDQVVDLGALALPVEVVGPALRREADPHGSISSCSSSWPTSAWAMDSRNVLAFAGVERRRMVASMEFQSSSDTVTIERVRRRAMTAGM